MHYVYLAIAIILEVMATSSLKASEEFTRLWPTLAVVVGYTASIYFMTLTLKAIPVGVTYALWSGLGIVLVAAAGAIFYNQKPDLPAIAGISLIIAGMIIIHLFSKMEVS